MPSRLSSLAAQLARRFASVRSPGFQFTEAEFADVALSLFQLQFELCPAYQRLCLMEGLRPGDVHEWQRIPAVPTVGFQELDLSCIPASERKFVFHSSGTTGLRPSRHFHHRESRALYETSLSEWFARHLLHPTPVGPGTDVRFLSLCPPPAEAPDSSLVHMLSVTAERYGNADSVVAGRRGTDGSWMIDFERVRRACDSASALGLPLLVFGTAFNFVHLLEHLERAPLSRPLPPGSSVMETGGYKGRSRELEKSELHAAITQVLGVPAARVGSEYGMSELSSQAYDRVWGDPSSIGGLEFPPWARALVISPETQRPVADGEAGLVRVVDLANVWSIQAVQTGDLGVLRGGRLELRGRARTATPRGCSLMTA